MHWMTRPALVLSICFATLAASHAADTPASQPADGFVRLFNGKDLAGWVITGCKAEVRNGNLAITDGNGWIRSDKIYGDFILEVEWKNVKAEQFDSGVYFRADLPRKGQNWPDKYQINLKQGEEGSLVGSRQGRVKGVAKAGEWNRMKLTCVGKNAELEVNGQPGWKLETIDPAQGYVGLQVEVPNGGQFEFRNIRIKAMTKPVDPPKP